MKTTNILIVFTLTLLILAMNANAQVKDYDADWKQVEENIVKGLPASALTTVKKIYTKAKAEKQEAQIVKSLIYMTQLQSENRDENLIAAISEIEKEISLAQEPISSLLNSYVAGLYQQYFSMNRYKLYNRTNTIGFNKDDIATWTVDDFHKKISALYLTSLQNERLLQQTKLTAYDALITKGNTRLLRPALYDLLAHRALDYFKSDERNITKPAYSFEINDSKAFSPAAEFAKASFNTNDSLSLQHKALLIYQRLIQLHLNDEKPDALIDLDLERLQYVYSKFLSENKEQLYYAALQQILAKHGNIPATAQAQFLIASIHQQKGNEYEAGKDTANRYELLKAKEITDKILKQKEESEGWVNAYNLNKQLVQPYLSFQLEKVNIPNEAFRMLVNFKNINKLYLRIVPATEALKKDLRNNPSNNKYWLQLATVKTLRAWEQTLPENADLQNHSVEIKIESLLPGEYFILASANKEFSSNDNILATRLTYISNISFVNNEDDFFVLDRNTGQPLSNANIQVWNNTYDYKTSSYKKTKLENFISDKNGYAHVNLISQTAKSRGNRSLLFEIQYKKDKLFIDEEAYSYYYNSFDSDNSKKSNPIAFLFTDRSIYRPGQTVYLKGIVVTKQNDGRKSVIYNGYKTTVSLLDANQQKVADIKIVANEYGSFNGKFELPQGGLNGMYTITTADNIGRSVFRMEEYKRPKFYVDFEKVKDTYKVNDDVKITGFAKAYAGNNIDGAKVKYRVVREARFPYPWLFWRSYLPQSTPLEITHGEAETDADGKFDITFKAIPDLKLSTKLDPVFDYKVYADVTDVNGETRSADEVVSAGYKSLLLKVNVADKLAADSLHKLNIGTENMSGVFQKADVQIKITQLKPEQRLLRTRYWEKPDQFIFTKDQYIQHFPNDIYDNEDDPKTWQQGQMVAQQNGSTDSTGVFLLDKKRIEPGYYMIEISTKDKEGNNIKDVQYVELFDAKEPEPVYPQYLYTIAPKPIEPGEKTNIEISTSAADIFLIQNIDKEESKYSFHSLNKENKTFNFSASEADRGGYGVSYLFVKNNRVFQSNQTIAVPWTNKELNIEYSSFRDKTLPGAEEKWMVKISGYKKEKVAAEMLVSMYDASLDQFYPHQWRKPYLWDNYYNRTNWNGNSNFGDATANIHNTNTEEYKNFDKRYDQIFTPGAFREYGKALVQQELMAGAMDEVVVVGYGVQRKSNIVGSVTTIRSNQAPAPSEVDSELGNKTFPSHSAPQVRTNFNETAFFFPDLKTDKEGNVSFSFTMPEALTRWKFQALAHTKDLALGYSTKEIVTQKDLMVQPNPPRFLREGDKMEFSNKVVNLSDKEITGITTFQLFDAATNEPMDGWFKNVIPQQYFTIAAGQSQSIQFPIEIPYHFDKALTWRMVAKATDNSISDGEQNTLPVLTNRMLVTETLPLQMRGSGTKNFKLDKLLNSENSETLTTQSLTVEYTSNPAWYAVQALPYMMQYPYECAEQTWNKYYANSLATLIANSSPKIKQVFEQWRTEDTAALLSNLQKNQELKSVLLEETPWVLAAKNETQQKKNIAVLFDLVRMSGELNNAYEKLRQLQSSNGGFVWFKGGPDDRYMTQYIITGIGHLKKLKAVNGLQEANLNRMVQEALPYLDAKIKEEYDNLIKYKTDLEKYVPSHYVTQYLYMRSFFPQNKIQEEAQKAVAYFRERSKKTWTKQNKYMQAMTSLAMHRNNDVTTSTAILKSLKETAINNEELGMYYKDAARSWWWYEAPIERQALIIEAFEEAGNDSKTADDLRTWLLKNKQTNNWESTKATAEAVYALLLRGSEWLTVTPDVEIKLGEISVSSKEEKTAEAGTGYFKKVVEGNKVRPSMGNISVTVQQTGASTLPTWGGVYWQYFEDLDKITTASTPLQLSKKLFIATNTDRGPELKPVNESDKIKVGDKIKVRIELRVDRDMEYVHMKDMRASSFEPVNVLSQYKWQGGLGYYETTKDASTNFFFNYLRKGTYVFEYDLFAQLAGTFSNGITTIQCMYAPEFTSHSEGVRVNVEN